MAKTGMIAAGFAAAIVCFASSTLRAEPVVPGAAEMTKYSFLRGSKWYVPSSTLPAMEMNLKNGKVSGVVDQTVWNITGYRYGYFWGTTAAVFTRQGTGSVSPEVSCASMLGSVTPDGQIYITFVGQGQKSTLGAVRGIGTLKPISGGWRFQMQMSTGTTSVLAHWSYMMQCKPGQACQAKLPGSNLSLSQFLAQCS